MTLAPLILAGCTLEASWEPKTSYRFERSLAEATQFLEARIKSCWLETWGWYRGRILLSTRKTPGYTVFEVNAYGASTGKAPAFIVVIVSAAVDGGTEVEVKDGPYGFETNIDRAPDVPRWIGGDVSC